MVIKLLLFMLIFVMLKSISIQLKKYKIKSFKKLIFHSLVNITYSSSIADFIHLLRKEGLYPFGPNILLLTI